MPPPAVPVDFNFNFTSQNGLSNHYSCSFNTGFPSSSSSDTSFSADSRPSSARPKPKSKPRLVKQRKSAKSTQAQAQSAVDWGINPFRLVSDTPNCCSSSFSNKFVKRVESSCLVFGVSNSSSSNHDSTNNDSGLHKQEFSFSEINGIRENNSAEGVGFCIGGVSKDRIGVCNGQAGEIGDDFVLMNKMKKLDIANVEKGSCWVEGKGHGWDNGDVSKRGDGLFVFKTGGMSSVPLESEGIARNSSRNGEGGNLEEKWGFGSEYVDNVFVFGSNANMPCDSRDQSTAFPADNKGERVKEDVLSSSFSTSKVDAEVGGAEPDACSSSGEKPESNVKHRGLKGRNLKKTKGKWKQSRNIEPQPVQIPVSSEGIIQGQEAPECYSPMDFSPYEPPSDPHASGNIPDVHIDSQLNDAGTDFNGKKNGHGGDADPFSFSSDKTGRGEEKFTITLSTSSQNHVSAHKRVQRRKYRMKTASVSASTSRVLGSSLDDTPLLSKIHGVSGNVTVSAGKDKDETEAVDGLGCQAYSVAEKACEKWRRRGNEAYEKGELAKAEDFYTWGVNCVPPGNASGVAFRPLVRCYSNRAATRMAVGRVREAIKDCLMAVKLDPSFHRAQIRAANCYLQLGEVDDAMQCFGKCMGSGSVVCLDRQVIISASEGIQKSQKVIEYTIRSAELLKLRTSEAATDVLQYIAEVMSISMHSEKLLELKAQALCILSRHEEVIKLCQETQDFAEKNFMDSVPESDGSSYVRRWRYHTLAKCYFHRGNLEVALDLLEKQELQNNTRELSEPFSVTIQELLKQKSAGNNAFHSGKHLEAIDHYTSAIYNSMESRPFAAICFCNRAAAYQALGQIMDAISDCSLAIALDETYPKAVSRRATLYEMIRDYKQAAADLQKSLSLQKGSLEKFKHSGSGKGKELRQVQQRLSAMEEEAKKDILLDLYLILGTKKCDPISEIKKAYRKAALRHHPDKAAQSLVKGGENGEQGHHWKDIAELVHKDSDRLFKTIGAAYAVLSDSTKREEYDLDEDMRKALKDCNNVSTSSRRCSEHYSQGSPFERSRSRRYWQDSHRTYCKPHRR